MNENSASEEFWRVADPPEPPKKRNALDRAFGLIVAAILIATLGVVALAQLGGKTVTATAGLKEAASSEVQGVASLSSPASPEIVAVPTALSESAFVPATATPEAPAEPTPPPPPPTATPAPAATAEPVAVATAIAAATALPASDSTSVDTTGEAGSASDTSDSTSDDTSTDGRQDGSSDDDSSDDDSSDDGDTGGSDNADGSDSTDAASGDSDTAGDSDTTGDSDTGDGDTTGDSDTTGDGDTGDGDSSGVDTDGTDGTDNTLGSLGALPGGAPSDSEIARVETDLISWINSVRSSAGVSAVVLHEGLASRSRTWSRIMSEELGTVDHCKDDCVEAPRPSTCQDEPWAENLAQGTDLEGLKAALLNSAVYLGHMQNAEFNTVGVGVVYYDGSWWMTHSFGRC